MGMLKGNPGGSTNASTDSSGFQEQDRYLIKIIETMPHTMANMRHPWDLFDSNLSINSLLLAAEDVHQQNQLSAMMKEPTPETGRRSSHGPFHTVRSFSNFGNRSTSTTPKANKWGSLKAGGVLPPAHHARETDKDSTLQYTFQRVPLYILGEKSQSKSIRLSEMNTEFIPVDYTDVRHARMSFKKLMRTVLPSTASNEPDQTFAKLLEQSEWLQQIRGLLQLSGAVVDLIDLQGSSVALALEEGWDVTAQVSALAQICLDPYYRTIEGFRVLVEKEWLAFGHRFGHRSNLKTQGSSGSPFAPVFLQFLDAVHQIQSQFPLAFEFNEFYLRFLAYHCVSCRFRTFIFDCELERFDLGIATIEDKRGSLNNKHVVETGTGSDDDIFPGGIRSTGVTGTQRIGYSLFDYIDRQHAKQSHFYNFMYTVDPERSVLRPQSSVSVLELWSYYVDEELAQGPAYDPELVCCDNLDDSDADYSSTVSGAVRSSSGGSGSVGNLVAAANNKHQLRRRRVVTIGYDSLVKCDPDAFTRLLDELKHAEAERGLLPQKWRQVWDKLELPHSDSLTRHSSFSSALVRSHGRLLHKR